MHGALAGPVSFGKHLLDVGLAMVVRVAENYIWGVVGGAEIVVLTAFTRIFVVGNHGEKFFSLFSFGFQGTVQLAIQPSQTDKIMLQIEETFIS